MKARLKNQPTFKGAWFQCPNARGNSNNGSYLSAGLAKLGLMNSGEDYGGEKRIGDCSLQCFTPQRPGGWLFHCAIKPFYPASFSASN